MREHSYARERVCTCLILLIIHDVTVFVKALTIDQRCKKQGTDVQVRL